MIKEILLLNKKFNEVKKMGWVKSLRNGTTGIGYTFETLLGKKEDRSSNPDYYGIEIKTMKYFSKKKIHLFNLTPNSSPLIIKKIMEKFGYPDKDFPEYKVFHVSFKVNKLKRLKNEIIKLNVNNEKKVIELIELGNNFDFEKVFLSWSFESIKNVLNLKLSTLAVVKACYKKIENEDYFFYNKINFYRIRSFDNFINLLNNGIIDVNFKIGIKKNSENLGEISDKGTDFSIMEKDINLLFQEIKCFDK